MSATPHHVEVPVSGMDCAGCARTVQQAISAVPGVSSAEVLLTAEKAIVDLDDTAHIEQIHRAIEAAGYGVPETDPRPTDREDDVTDDSADDVSRQILRLFGSIFAAVLVVVVAGEVLGLLDWLVDAVPWYVGALAVAGLGYPVFKQVVRSTLRGHIIAHTLMAVGAGAALIAGQWVTALIVVFFMRMGDYAERFTTEQTRESVRSLTRMAPQTARVVWEDEERTVAVDEVEPDDIVVVRPGERIPVDGIVVAGHATVDQSAITGESMPVEAVPGRKVFAATIAGGGSLRVRSTAAGRDSTFGRVIEMVQQAERHRGAVQRYADRFSTYYLPVVAAIAGATYLFGGGLMATVAVLVVACSCAFALATPAAILASVGAAAKQGLLIKGGKYVEALSRADVVLVDKTGTLTLGRPEIREVTTLNGFSEDELIRLGASAERYSEHPLADAVRRLAADRGIELAEPEDFHAVPGAGVHARVNGMDVRVGSERVAGVAAAAASTLELATRTGTRLYIDVDGQAGGVLSAADADREEVPVALDALRQMGIEHIELLTGDRQDVAAELASRLGITFKAELLPEDKIEIVRHYQGHGHTVVMIGDGVNDAPALAQADVGIAMSRGTDVATESAHVALMRDDWSLVPSLFRIARRTMGVVRLNIGFTAAYNVVGLALAAFGFLPPIYAAAAQSLPDIGIMANSARLIRQDDGRSRSHAPVT
ncbi:MAG: cation-translocating P-type ATPase [Rhodothermales bacterium]